MEAGLDRLRAESRRDGRLSRALDRPRRSHIHSVMHKTVVINAVGLTPSLIGPETPRIKALADAGRIVTINPVIPAVTCSVQSTYLTGAWPREHGIVGNGWYFRDECEIKFWKQSNRLVTKEKIWDIARRIDPGFTCANICWWYNMYSTADFTVTPRPMYPADGRKLPDCHTHPAHLRDELQRRFGTFPLFQFWGPATDIAATEWIANAAIHVDEQQDPTLSLIYLPHLDYVMQRHGPGTPEAAKDLRELDTVCGRLIDHFSRRGARIMLISEYGISRVSRPVHVNRVLREAGLIAVRQERGRELLDAGASRAFAVADHQVAHVYINDLSCIEQVHKLLASTPGVARVLDEGGKRELRLDHPRSGELVALAEPQAWFTYYHWLDESRRPDYANTVDIHRKPGYDPVELFLDPNLRLPRLRIAAMLLKKKLGFRTLLNVISTDATLVRGSHGVAPARPEEGAFLVTPHLDTGYNAPIEPTEVQGIILRHLHDAK